MYEEACGTPWNSNMDWRVEMTFKRKRQRELAEGGPGGEPEGEGGEPDRGGGTDAAEQVQPPYLEVLPESVAFASPAPAPDASQPSAPDVPWPPAANPTQRNQQDEQMPSTPRNSMSTGGSSSGKQDGGGSSSGTSTPTGGATKRVRFAESSGAQERPGVPATIPGEQGPQAGQMARSGVGGGVLPGGGGSHEEGMFGPLGPLLMQTHRFQPRRLQQRARAPQGLR